MNPTVAGALAGLIIGAPGFIVAIVTLRSNARSAEAANQLEKRKVDRDEFETLVTELRRQLADERRLRRRGDRRVVQLEHAMYAAGIPVPPVLPDPEPDPEDED